LPKAIHQLLAVFDEADAQGAQALILQRIFRSWGFNSKIFAGISAPGHKNKIFPAVQLDLPGDPEELLIFHYSIGSPVGELFRRSFRSQVLIYHNITPATFFRDYDELTFLECQKGRRQLNRFVSSCGLALADSSFNAAELKAVGFNRVEVLPLPLDENRLRGSVDPVILSNYGRDARSNLLFVGRLVPNKKQEDILLTFHFFQTLFQPDSRLFLVGPDHIPAYTRTLRKQIDDLKIKNTFITGKVSWKKLRAYYRTADLFLCLSEHEGFCVPLIESLYYKIPIVAYAAGAVTETLGESGILLREKKPLQIAGLIHRILNDNKLKSKILKGQQRRLEQLQRFHFEDKLKEYLQPFIK
jgi:glycosyltransferase involved in cell wall biosynthesis